MPKTKILIIDDDPDIRDVLMITLSQEDYDVVEAGNGEEGIQCARAERPDLIIVDYMMPKKNGREVCTELKNDMLFQHVPIIMLTGKGDTSDKVGGLNAGADDYIVKPFEPDELIARIRMIIRRASRDLDANPLTRLPGNLTILSELQKRIDSKAPFAVCYVDLDKFKSFNDKYGFKHGDELIKETARILITSCSESGNPHDFVGHIGGDDFVVITTPDKADTLCTHIINEYDKAAPTFYNEEDKQAGFIMAHDRQGTMQKIPLTSVSIGIVSNEKRSISHVAEIGEIGAELKKRAKQVGHSNYVKDLRSGD